MTACQEEGMQRRIIGIVAFDDIDVLDICGRGKSKRLQSASTLLSLGT